MCHPRERELWGKKWKKVFLKWGSPRKGLCAVEERVILPIRESLKIWNEEGRGLTKLEKKPDQSKRSLTRRKRFGGHRGIVRVWFFE